MFKLCPQFPSLYWASQMTMELSSPIHTCDLPPMDTAPEKLQTLTAIFKLQVHDKEQYDQMAHWPVSKRLLHLVSLFARDYLNEAIRFQRGYSAKQVLDWAEVRLLEHLNIRQDSTSKDRYTILVTQHPAWWHRQPVDLCTSSCTILLWGTTELLLQEKLHASHSAI